MVKNDYILSSVFNCYRNRKDTAENKAYEINQKLLHDKNYTENHYKIKSLNFDISKAEYEEDFVLADKLKNEREKLKKIESEILKEKGLTPESLIPHYHCSKCNDTGYTKDNKLCDCFFKTLSDVAHEILNIPKQQLPSFNNFKIFSKKGEKLKNLLLDYVDKFPPEKIKNLLFTGSTGTGKTFAAGCIANELINKKHNVIYLTATKLNDVFMNYHTASIGDKQAISDFLTHSDLLVIDDLGTEPIFKNITIEYLTSFISERINEKKPFIVTTNLSMEELKNRYTERLFSRLCGDECARIEINGEDLRLKK